MRANKLADQLTRGTLAVVLALPLTFTAGVRPAVAAMELGQEKHFDIPPQQLPAALLKFSEQSGVQVTSPGQLVEGRKSPGVVGTFSPSKALAMLLKDTSLNYDVVDGNTVVITGSANSKVSRNDLQKVSDAGNAPPLPDNRELKLAQAASSDVGQNRRVASANNADNSPSSGADSKERVELEEVIVTGSSIKQISGETALPVQVMKREEIERTGATSVEELFRDISAASSAGNTVAAQETGTQTGAISTISLRGLTSARTLVLIDGKRAAVYGGGSTGVAGSSVDISSIPIAAIERVEILKDGASAVYGSDAIAGVVNFILRKNFQGAEISATGGTPTDHGGGQNETVSAYVGHGDIVQDRYNAAIGFNFEHDTALMGNDRAFATRYSPGYGNDVTSGFAFPANVAIPANPNNPLLPAGGTRNPSVPACSPSLADVNFPTQCRFDNSGFDSLAPEVKKLNFSFNGELAVGGSSQLYTQDSFAQTKTTTTVQPVPLSYQNALLPSNPYNAYLANLLATQYPGYKNSALTPLNAAFLLPPSSPYYPHAFAAQYGIDGQPLNLIYRDFANGSRLTEDTANTIRFVAGFKGDTAGWDYDSWFLYNQVKVTEDLEHGYALYSEIMPLLDSGVINPFGPTTDPNALAQANAATFVGQDFQSKTSLTSLNGRISRDLLTLPAGPLSAAAGAEVRRETFEYDPATVIQTGDVTGEGGNQLPENASRNVESAFVEFNAFVAQGLQADAAVRYDNYQTVGSTVNPKGSLRWQPIEQVLVRASAGTGFRAPSLTDLYASQATSITSNGTRDPIQCATFNPNNPACSFQFTTITGGNPNLKPEKSQSYTLGLVIEPIKDLSVDLDSWWIFLKNQIVVGGLGYATILQNQASAEEFASLVNRNSAGQIVSISQTNANLFKSSLSGLDMDLKYRLHVGNTGMFTLYGNGTYFYRYVTQNPNGTWSDQIDQGINQVSNGGVISRFRYSATAAYEMGPWGLSLTENYQKRYHDTASSITQQNRFVSAYETVNGQFFYTGLKSFKFTVGAKNLFNRSPPYANYAATTNNFIGGYDVSYGDPLGRFVYASVAYSIR
jgi:iron complex outermembrane recepter protein